MMMESLSLLEITGLVLVSFSELGIILSPYTFHLFPKPRREKPPASASVNRIAAVVCAHNEESTIGNLLNILREQTRPADSVYVVADNCSDRTAAIAESMGAVVLQKEATASGGKGDALKFFLEKTRDEHFDGFVFFDADTLPNNVFLEKIIPGLEQAEMAVGHHSFVNVSTTWAEAGNATLGHVMWHHYLEPRYRNGVYSLVMGMGYGLRRSYLERLQWTPRTRTEDLALSLDAALTGAGFMLCPEAQFRDKQPETWAVSWHRMRRWMTGDLQCLHFYFLPLLKQVLRGDLMKADFLLFLLSVPTMILKAFGLLCLVAAAALGNGRMLLLILGIDLLASFYAVLSKKKQLNLQFFNIPALFFFYEQLPWIALSTFILPTRHWVPGRQAPANACRRNSGGAPAEKDNLLP